MRAGFGSEGRGSKSRLRRANISATSVVSSTHAAPEMFPLSFAWERPRRDFSFTGDRKYGIIGNIIVEAKAAIHSASRDGKEIAVKPKPVVKSKRKVWAFKI